MPPRKAVAMYLEERKPEVSDSTWQNHSYTLQRFTEFCRTDDITDISNLDGFDIRGFKIARRDDDISEVTLYNNMCVLRVFVRWLESLNVIESGIADSIIIPEAKGVRHEMIPEEVAEDILHYLDKFEYASLRHAFFTLLWHTGMRIGAARSIDLDEYHSGEEPYVELQHRPDSETPLKNGTNAEREVNLTEWCARVLDDYIQHTRPDVTDDYNRHPLFASPHGRYCETNLRQHINVVTRPCHYGEVCPHDKDPETCEAATNYEHAQRCPSTVPPHGMRRSAITHWLNGGHSKELISDRMDVSIKVLEEHYDGRTESEKREVRRELFEMD